MSLSSASKAKNIPWFPSNPPFWYRSRKRFVFKNSILCNLWVVYIINYLLKSVWVYVVVENHLIPLNIFKFQIRSFAYSWGRVYLTFIILKTVGISFLVACLTLIVIFKLSSFKWNFVDYFNYLFWMLSLCRALLCPVEYWMILSFRNTIEFKLLSLSVVYFISIKWKKMSIKFELKTISIRIGLLVITSYDITAYFKYSHSKPPMLKYVANITLKLSCVADYFEII